MNFRQRLEDLKRRRPTDGMLMYEVYRWQCDAFELELELLAAMVERLEPETIGVTAGCVDAVHGHKFRAGTCIHCGATVKR